MSEPHFVDVDILFVPNDTDLPAWEAVRDGAVTLQVAQWEVARKVGARYSLYGFDTAQSLWMPAGFTDPDTANRRRVKSHKMLHDTTNDTLSFGSSRDAAAVENAVSISSCSNAFVHLRNSDVPALCNRVDGQWKLHSDNTAVSTADIQRYLVFNVVPTDAAILDYAQAKITRASNRQASIARPEPDASPVAQETFPPNSSWSQLLSRSAPSYLAVGSRYVCDFKGADGSSGSVEGVAVAPDQLSVHRPNGGTMTIAFPPADVTLTSITKKDGLSSGLPAFKALPTLIDPDKEDTWGAFLETAEGQVALYDHLLLHYTRKISGDTSSIERLVTNLLHDMRCSGQRWQVGPFAETIRRQLRELRIMHSARLHGLTFTDVEEQLRSEAHLHNPEMAAALKVKAKKKPTTSSQNHSFRGKQSRAQPPRTQCSHCWGFYHTSDKCFDKLNGKPAAQRPADAGTHKGQPVRIA
eukprot:PhM_4_TR18876/c1_g1_i2/m.48213